MILALGGIRFASSSGFGINHGRREFSKGSMIEALIRAAYDVA
jgi:hypothetical protein